MSGMGGGLQTLLAFLGALLLLIVVHEWGHFWVARRMGVKVLRFSVGFGKPLWTTRRGADQTEFVIAAFPLGGYVKMLDQREAPVAAHELHRAFDQQSLAKRAAIVSAGPLANFILALLLYWGLYLNGVPGLKPYVNTPAAETIAAQSGFQSGELIVHFSGQDVRNWSELQLHLIDAALDHERVKVDAIDVRGHLVVHTLDLSSWDSGDSETPITERIGLVPWDFPIVPQVGRVLPDSAAARAGLRAGDRVIAMEGAPTASWQDFVRMVRSHPNQALHVQIDNGGVQRELILTPELYNAEAGKAVGRIGAAPAIDPTLEERLGTTVHYGLWGALTEAGQQTWKMTRLTFKTFGMMVMGQASWKNVGGPVQIATYAGQSAKMGLIPYLSFLALISISLGALNLLPVPLLDGGYLMYYVVEFIKGSPVSDEIMAVTQRIGLMLLTALMGFALYNDIHRLLTN
jgi:regulator of sigma E protease